MARVGAEISEPLCDMLVRSHSLVYFQAAGYPVGQLAAGQKGLEPIQVGMRTAVETGRVAHTEAAVGEPQQRAVAVGGEFVAHHAVLDDRLLPLVLEHMR